MIYHQASLGIDTTPVLSVSCWGGNCKNDSMINPRARKLFHSSFRLPINIEDTEEFYANFKKTMKTLKHELAQFTKDALDYRNKGIYVNYSQDENTFSSPFEINQQNAENVKTRVNWVYDFV